MYTIYMIWLTQRGCRISNLRFVTPCIIVQFKINHQPDATIFQFIILTFIYSSKYFGRSPEAATTVIELLMMGGKTHETCWAVNKLENCCIWLVIYLNWSTFNPRNIGSYFTHHCLRRIIFTSAAYPIIVWLRSHAFICHFTSDPHIHLPPVPLVFCLRSTDGMLVATWLALAFWVVDNRPVSCKCVALLYGQGQPFQQIWSAVSDCCR